MKHIYYFTDGTTKEIEIDDIETYRLLWHLDRKERYNNAKNKAIYLDDINETEITISGSAEEIIAKSEKWRLKKGNYYRFGLKMSRLRIRKNS